MDRKLEVSEFLSSRRAKITPREAGLPVYGGNRRVAGLRREEVAMLAGVSVEYYVRLERAQQDLIGELSTRSEDFNKRWAAHDVRFHRTGGKRLRHPVVGDLTLNFESFELPADDGLTMVVYDAEPDSRTAEALALLASWSSAAVER